MYKFLIKSFDEDYITLHENENSVNVTFEEFTNQFYSSRNFAFVNHFLPKVIVYFSPIFRYMEQNTAFLITQMRPTVRKDISEKIVFPWSFFFVLADLDKCKILESHLFFSSTQMLSEENHKFYVPSVKTSALQSSPFFTNILDIKMDSFVSTIESSYSKLNFGTIVNELHQMALAAFLIEAVDNKDIEWVNIEELEELDEEKQKKLERKFSTYWDQESFVLSNIFDSFSLKMHQNPPNFLDLIQSFFETS